MADIDVLLLVNLPERSPYQELEFFQQMEEQGWQLVEDGQALFAAYSGSIGDREVVVQCQQDLRRAAEYSCVKGWDAVCLLKDSSDQSRRFAMIEQLPKQVATSSSQQLKGERHAGFDQNHRARNRGR